MIAAMRSRRFSTAIVVPDKLELAEEKLARFAARLAADAATPRRRSWSGRGVFPLVDYLETNKDIDARRIRRGRHSRNGKTALVAALSTSASPWRSEPGGLCGRRERVAPELAARSEWRRNRDRGG